MVNTLPIVRTVAELRHHLALWRKQDMRIGLVPTMGALHSGHLSLVTHCREYAARTLVSIFVNPTQFGAGEDIERYPRTEAEDVAQLAGAGCDLVYAPSVSTMYPDGFATTVHVSGMDDLCGAARPGHFDGVATVVAKLLIQSEPDVAVFGEKDFQQLTLIRRLVRDLDLDTAIVMAPLVRDADGLALSSRNSYLTADERRAAVSLPMALHTARTAIVAGGNIAATLAAAHTAMLAGGFSSVDYVELRHENDLSPPFEQTLFAESPPMRLLAAARMGTTRLIDTLAL